MVLGLCWDRGRVVPSCRSRVWLLLGALEGGETRPGLSSTFSHSVAGLLGPPFGPLLPEPGRPRAQGSNLLAAVSSDPTWPLISLQVLATTICSHPCSRCCPSSCRGSPWSGGGEWPFPPSRATAPANVTEVLGLWDMAGRGGWMCGLRKKL